MYVRYRAGRQFNYRRIAMAERGYLMLIAIKPIVRTEKFECIHFSKEIEFNFALNFLLI